MVEIAKLGLRDTNGVISKQTVENRLLPKLKEKLGHEISFIHYQSRVKWFKKQYSNYSQLIRHNSGFGWDATTKKFTAPEEVWADYLKSHPDHANLRSETFPDYEDLRIAVGNGTATGMGAIGLGENTDATVLGVDDESGGIGGIDGLFFYPNTNMFTMSENVSSHQEDLSHLPQDESRNIEDPPSSSNRAKGKRGRNDFENNRRTKEPNSHTEVTESLSVGFNKIVKSFDKICYLMEKRESREGDLLDAMKETPGLTNEDCFRALDLLNTKAKQDFFLKMTPEQRYHWITSL
ncbi:unnamed protein product [Cuscuta epithymum]|uniref:Myb/SANT-like domain-containing protein n=1 Tax=Cuscuta epithymum TaxID=186058 RepID=A0AAV0F127_9ASTE|nr:unnamed protein product [Cuscuta epithymum]